jgi:hypothetical protein
MTPARIRIGIIAEMSNAKSWTMSVVPTFAPNMAAKAIGRATKPRSRKPASIKAVAVLLCKRAVTARPEANALILSPIASRST